MLQLQMNTVSQPDVTADTPLFVADEALLAEISRGDSSALSTFYDRHAGQIYGLALRILGSTQSAEEIVQDTFLRVWQRSEQFRPERGNVNQWLFGIAHHLCIDELRRRKTRIVAILDSDTPALLELQHAGPPLEEEVLLRERRQIIRSALSEIPLEQRRVIELAYFSGLSQNEIAAHTGEPLGTIKTRARLGLSKLREILTARHILGT